MMQGLYNQKVAVPSVFDTLLALFIVPSAIYMIAKNLILFSSDSPISVITFRHPIIDDNSYHKLWLNQYLVFINIMTM